MGRGLAAQDHIRQGFRWPVTLHEHLGHRLQPDLQQGRGRQPQPPQQRALAYIGGLAASVQAFGGGAGITEIGAVYLGAALIAAASPTPGGLGAIEAALVAGLTGVGLPAGPAVSAVLTYRLATYWLPVLPGWISLRILQKRDYI